MSRHPWLGGVINTKQVSGGRTPIVEEDGKCVQTTCGLYSQERVVRAQQQIQSDSAVFRSQDTQFSRIITVFHKDIEIILPFLGE